MLSADDFMQKQIIFVFLNFGDKLSFSNDNIVIKNNDGKIKHQSTCYRLFLLFVVGDCSITSGLLQRAKKFGFSIVFMTHSMRIYALFGYGMEGNTLLHRYQYEYNSLKIGAHIIKNKVDNQLVILQRIRNKDEATQKAVILLKEHIRTIECIEYNDLALTALLGIEGSAARTYFHRLFSDMDWRGRKPRVKHDMVNCLLDVGYTLLFNVMESILHIYGFDVYMGVLHKQFYMRKSLVYDLVEPFRPLIDWRIRVAVHLGECKEEDFLQINGQYQLKWQCSAKYVALLMEPLIKEKEGIFLYVQSYYRAFMKQKEGQEYPVFLIGGSNADRKL